MKLLMLFVLSTVAVSVPARASESEPKDSPRIVNEASKLATLTQRNGDPGLRAAALYESLRSHSDLYREVLGIQNLQEECRTYAGSLDAQLNGLTHLSVEKTLAADVRSHLRAFRAKFPALDTTNLTIYVLPSFGRFNAQARTFQGKPVILLDSAFFANSGGSVPAPIFQHELFHIYHGQLRPEIREGTEAFFARGTPPSLATLLWVEGLAVYATRQLNPDATEAALFPAAGVVAATDASLPGLLREVRSNLASATMPGISGFFYFPRMDGRAVPQNCGYVIGERIVKRMATHRTLDQIILLPLDELEGAIDSSLNDL